MSIHVSVRKANLKNLIFGLILLFFDVGVILYVLGYIRGVASDGERFIITYEGLRFFVIVMLVILVFGFCAGYEIGKYVEEVYVERNEKQRPV